MGQNMAAASTTHSLRGLSRPAVRAALSLLSLALLLATPGTAGAVSPACDRACHRMLELCQPTDAACAGRNLLKLPQVAVCGVAQAECQAKLRIYRAYMDHIAQGTTRFTLRRRYVALLNPYFPGVDLSQVRIAYSPRQPAHNATTDCLNIYVNDPVMVTQTVLGTLPVGLTEGAPDPVRTQLDWLLHELRHVEQCKLWGGRDHYALRWMQDVAGAMVRRLSVRYDEVHADQAMERDADLVAGQVLARLSNNIDVWGQLVPELDITAVQRAGFAQVGADPVVIAVGARGGSSPLSFRWTVRPPGQRRFKSLARGEGHSIGSMFAWTPRLAGRYTIRVEVFQAQSLLRPATRTLTMVVAPSLLQAFERVDRLAQQLLATPAPPG